MVVHRFGRLTTVDRDITARCIVIMNRADPGLVRSFPFTPSDDRALMIILLSSAQLHAILYRQLPGRTRTYLRSRKRIWSNFTRELSPDDGLSSVVQR